MLLSCSQLIPCGCMNWLGALRMSRVRQAVAVGLRVGVDGKQAVVDGRQLRGDVR